VEKNKVAWEAKGGTMPIGGLGKDSFDRKTRRMNFAGVM